MWYKIPIVLGACALSAAQMLVRYIRRDFTEYNTILVRNWWGFTSPHMQQYWQRLNVPEKDIPEDLRKEFGGSKFHRYKRLGAEWVSQSEQVPVKVLSLLAVMMFVAGAAVVGVLWTMF